MCQKDSTLHRLGDAGPQKAGALWFCVLFRLGWFWRSGPCAAIGLHAFEQAQGLGRDDGVVDSAAVFFGGEQAVGLH